MVCRDPEVFADLVLDARRRRRRSLLGREFEEQHKTQLYVNAGILTTFIYIHVRFLFLSTWPPLLKLIGVSPTLCGLCPHLRCFSTPHRHRIGPIDQNQKLKGKANGGLLSPYCTSNVWSAFLGPLSLVTGGWIQQIRREGKRRRRDLASTFSPLP